MAGYVNGVWNSWLYNMYFLVLDFFLLPLTIVHWYSDDTVDFYLECTEFISCLGYSAFLTGFSWFSMVPVGEWWYHSLK